MPNTHTHATVLGFVNVRSSWFPFQHPSEIARLVGGWTWSVIEGIRCMSRANICE